MPYQDGIVIVVRKEDNNFDVENIEGGYSTVLTLDSDFLLS